MFDTSPVLDTSMSADDKAITQTEASNSPGKADMVLPDGGKKADEFSSDGCSTPAQQDNEFTSSTSDSADGLDRGDNVGTSNAADTPPLSGLASRYRQFCGLCKKERHRCKTCRTRHCQQHPCFGPPDEYGSHRIGCVHRPPYPSSLNFKIGRSYKTVPKIDMLRRHPELLPPPYKRMKLSADGTQIESAPDSEDEETAYIPSDHLAAGDFGTECRRSESSQKAKLSSTTNLGKLVGQSTPPGSAAHNTGASARTTPGKKPKRKTTSVPTRGRSLPESQPAFKIVVPVGGPGVTLTADREMIAPSFYKRLMSSRQCSSRGSPDRDSSAHTKHDVNPQTVQNVTQLPRNKVMLFIPLPVHTKSSQNDAQAGVRLLPSSPKPAISEARRHDHNYTGMVGNSVMINTSGMTCQTMSNNSGTSSGSAPSNASCANDSSVFRQSGPRRRLTGGSHHFTDLYDLYRNRQLASGVAFSSIPSPTVCRSSLQNSPAKSQTHGNQLPSNPTTTARLNSSAGVSSAAPVTHDTPDVDAATQNRTTPADVGKNSPAPSSSASDTSSDGTSPCLYNWIRTVKGRQPPLGRQFSLNPVTTSVGNRLSLVPNSSKSKSHGNQLPCKPTTTVRSNTGADQSSAAPVTNDNNIPDGDGATQPANVSRNSAATFSSTSDMSSDGTIPESSLRQQSLSGVVALSTLSSGLDWRGLPVSNQHALYVRGAFGNRLFRSRGSAGQFIVTGSQLNLARGPQGISGTSTASYTSMGQSSQMSNTMGQFNPVVVQSNPVNITGSSSSSDQSNLSNGGIGQSSLTTDAIAQAAAAAFSQMGPIGQPGPFSSQLNPGNSSFTNPFSSQLNSGNSSFMNPPQLYGSQWFTDVLNAYHSLPASQPANYSIFMPMNSAPSAAFANGSVATGPNPSVVIPTGPKPGLFMASNTAGPSTSGLMPSRRAPHRLQSHGLGFVRNGGKASKANTQDAIDVDDNESDDESYDEAEHIKNSIQKIVELFPDVCPKFAEQLLGMGKLKGNDCLEYACNYLLEHNNYRRVRPNATVMCDQPGTSKDQQCEDELDLTSSMDDPERDGDVNMIECLRCQQHYNFKDMLQCCDGHLFCKDCLTAHVKALVYGQGKLVLLCLSSDCSAAIPRRTLMDTLPTQLFLKYEERLQREAISLTDLPDLVQCPHCNFAAELASTESAFFCQDKRCGKVTCRRCKADWQHGKPCCTSGAPTSSSVATNLDVPHSWEGALTADFRVVKVKEDTNEYQQVKSNFMLTNRPGYATVVDIHRVQNLELWENFVRKKQKLLKKYNGVASLVNERLVYHGTKPQYIDAIIKTGFDWRLSGFSSGAVFGKGSYFAFHSCTSDKYVGPLPERTLCQILVARVVLGSSTLGHPGLVRPPPRDLNNPLVDLFDSCVNHTQSPSIYVLFEKDQAYPEYIITYRREQPFTQ